VHFGAFSDFSREVHMSMKSLPQAATVLLVVGAAALLGAVLGRAQSVYPVRLDQEPAALITSPPSWAEMGALRLTPQNRPPVTCNAANVGLFYIQADVQSTIPSPQVNTAPCCCTTCVDAVFCTGSTGYADAGFYWLNTAGSACAQLWELPPL
jgi:hypothetical protein